jgi:acylphosphatase
VVLAHRLRIHGRVQGVGFRAYVYREARLAEVDGWVRNRRDGTVEAMVWGKAAVIDSLLERIEEGPRFGRVDRVDVTVETGGEERPDGFDIRPDR